MRIYSNYKLIICIMLIILMFLGCSQSKDNPRNVIPSVVSSKPAFNTEQPTPKSTSPILVVNPLILDAEQLILNARMAGVTEVREIINNSMGDLLYGRVKLTGYYYFYNEYVPQLCCRIVFEDDDRDLIREWLKKLYFDLRDAEDITAIKRRIENQDFNLDEILFTRTDPVTMGSVKNRFSRWETDFENSEESEWIASYWMATEYVYIISDPNQWLPMSIHIPFCFGKNAAGQNVLFVGIAYKMWEMRIY